MCVKPYEVDGDGLVLEVCSSKPAHHTGSCGPWMPWDGPARGHTGAVIDLVDVDFGRFPTAEELDEHRRPARERNEPHDTGDAW